MTERGKRGARCSPMQKQIFLDDIVSGRRVTAGPYRATTEEIVEFGRRWDPLPHHVDEAAAAASMFGGLIAPGIYVLAIKMNLIHRLPENAVVLASMGYDEVRFLQPVRPGDDLTLEMEWVEKRPSNSKPDCGIAKQRFTLFNQHGQKVLNHLDTILVPLRNPAPARG